MDAQAVDGGVFVRGRLNCHGITISFSVRPPPQEKPVMRTAIMAFLVSAALARAAGADLRVGANDTIQTVLAGQKGARVTVRVRSGQELTGVVREVNARVVQLGGLSGKEFFDAVVPLEAVDAVL